MLIEALYICGWQRYDRFEAEHLHDTWGIWRVEAHDWSKLPGDGPKPVRVKSENGDL